MKNIIQGIKNIIKYIPIIWKDRDWDYQYLESLLLFKYKNIYKTMASFQNMYMEENVKTLKALELIITILERRKTDWYFELYSKHPLTIKQNFVFVPYNEQYQELKSDLTKDEIYELTIYNSQLQKTRERDWRIYNNIINKYQETFWV